MKTKLFALIGLALVLSSCGKKDEPAVTTAAPITTCSDPNMVWGPNGCAPIQYGTPPGYNYGNNNYPPVNVTLPQGGCPSGQWQMPYGGGYGGGYYPGYYNQGYNRCYHTNRFRWYFHGGFYWYF